MEMTINRPEKVRKKSEDRNSRISLLFLLPAILFIALFMVYPMLYSGYLSFTSWDGVSAKEFIGLSNYKTLFRDPYFFRGLLNNFLIAVVSLVLQVFFSTIIAYVLVRMIKVVQRLYMFFYLVPVVISEICIGLLWGFIYDPYFGLLNNTLRLLGWGKLATGWLGNPDTAFISVLNAMNFTYMGLYIILFVAAVQNIPESVFDAAKIDGAGNFKTFFAVVLPMMWDSIQSVALMAVISSFKTFSLVFVLTNGGPNHITEVLSTYLYSMGFNSFRMGYASTIGFVQMVLTTIIGLLVIKTMRKTSAGAYDV